MGKLTKKKSEEGAPMYRPSINIYDNEHLDEIGLKKLPVVGDVMEIKGKVKVTSVSMSENEYDGSKKKHRSVSMEIEELDVERGKKTSQELADSFYKES